MKRILLVCSFVLLLLAGYSLAGVVFEIEVKDHDSSRSGEMEVRAEGRNISIDVLPGRDGRGKGKMIFRGDRGDGGQVVVVDDDKKGYYVMDKSTMAGIAGQVGAAMAEVEKALAQLSKEQREAIEKMQRRQGGMAAATGQSKGRPKHEIRNTGQRGTKAGYPCVKYDVYRDGRKVRELWVTDWSNIDGGSEAADAFKAMGEFFNEMLDSLGELPGGGGSMGGVNPYEEMNFEAGFPVVSTSFDEAGEIDDESILRSASRRRLDPDAFEPPSGYKRMSMGPQ